MSYLLQSLTCQHLDIGATDLSSEENSKALLDAIRGRVENLCLDSETTVKFSVLEEYDGQGASVQTNIYFGPNQISNIVHLRKIDQIE